MRAPLLLVLALAVGLGGCFGEAPPVPRDHYYRLLVGMPAEAAGNPGGGHLDGIVMVRAFDASGLLRERPLLYSASGGATEVQQHDYQYWTDTPPRMLQDQLVAYLRQSGIADAVVTPDLRAAADFEVIGKVKRLERLLGGNPADVVAELELAVLRTADDALIVVDSYVVEGRSADTSVEAAVDALNLAVTEIFARFLADLQKL